MRITASGSSSRTKKEEEKLNYVGTPKKTNLGANVIINNDQIEVRTFLNSIKLEKYYDKFINHGV